MNIEKNNLNEHWKKYIVYVIINKAMTNYQPTRVSIVIWLLNYMPRVSDRMFINLELDLVLVPRIVI